MSVLRKCTDFPCFSQKRASRGAIFLDRDGTVITEKNYLRDLADLSFLPGVTTNLKRLIILNMPLYLFTNQAVIAHGLLDEPGLNRIHLSLYACLRKLGIHLSGILYCPHHPQAEVEFYRLDCYCRKPNPGLLYQAAKVDGIDLGRSYVIGDKKSDIAAGKSVGAKTALVLTGYGKNEVSNLDPDSTPDLIASNIAVIVDWILKKERKSPNSCVKKPRCAFSDLTLALPREVKL